jgi:hypothetical protein
MSNHLGSAHHIEQDGIVLKSNDQLRFFATYTTVDGITCNTEPQTYTANGAEEQTASPISTSNAYVTPLRSARSSNSRIQSAMLLPTLNRLNRNEMEIHAPVYEAPLTAAASPASSGACPSIAFEQKVEKQPHSDSYSVSFASKSLPLERVELHYQLGQQQSNVKMTINNRQAELNNINLKDVSTNTDTDTDSTGRHEQTHAYRSTAESDRAKW